MSERFESSDLREIFAKANEENSGGQLSGLAARFERERVAAKRKLADTSLAEIVNSNSSPNRIDCCTPMGTITAPQDASPEAAGIEAAYQVLSTYFPASQASLYAERINSLASIPDGQAKIDGIATGDVEALAMISLRANDGSSPPQFKIPGPPVPGEWQATPSCPIVNGVAVGIAFQWQNVTPFGIPNGSDFLLGPPPALTSNQYAKAYNEVMTVGSIDSTERPQDRANVALFCAASSPTQVPPSKLPRKRNIRCPKTLVLWP